ncbi:hypothetical protein TNCV_4230581 [Trichonephila clavipes]|uniref:Uncharacterized protein n=1 Tax=Trichonephila clavipes TaxID=2585209 RepID=A0A8X6VLA7_TRICX|nr:hypothetical protein TNCV_4230581 [Trichonephila clavipes]
MGLYKQKSVVLDGFEQCRMGMSDHYLTEFIQQHSQDHLLSDEAYKVFLKSAVKLYPLLRKDQHSASFLLPLEPCHR